MSTILLGIEAIGTRITSHWCPRGIAGRIHTLRLRRRFQTAGQPYSTVSGSFENWHASYDAHTNNTSDLNSNNQQQQQYQSPLPSSSEIQPPERDIGSDSNDSVQPTFVDTTSTTASHAVPSQVPNYLIEANQGDTAGLEPIGSWSNVPDHGRADDLHKAVQTESPHAIMNALTRLITVSQNRIHGHAAFCMLSPNTFTEILRCLDPEHFVGRYVDLHEHNDKLASSSLATLRHQKEGGMYHFCAIFMTRIKMILLARRSGGFKPSLSDYKILLRCAASVGDPRASQTMWRAIESDGYEPDTECYNYYLSGILKVGMLNGTQRSDLRTPSLPRSMRQDSNEVSQSDYDRLGVNFRYETTRMFDDMLQRGVAGDERTFCLLMISSARVGDVESVKAILGKVWGIYVDDLMTENEKDYTEPYSYAIDSPFRPTTTLIFALVHCFGINNMIPVALRLVDFVSRRFSLTIPIQAWEDLLGLTYAASVPKALGRMAKEEGTPSLHIRPEAVRNVWSVMTSEPFNVKPNLEMYDRLIVNLLRRQRFGEAKERMEEAWKIHIRNVHDYGKTVAIADFQSTFFEREVGSEELETKQGTKAYENYLGLLRDKTFHHLTLKFGHQYFVRWCRIMISDGSHSLKKNQNFILKDLPGFIYKYRHFMPSTIRYHTGTGYISFPSGVQQLNWEKAAKKGQQSSPHNCKLVQDTISSEQPKLESINS